MVNRVFDVLSGKIRILWGKINAAFLSGYVAQDFFDYTDQEVGKETLEKVAARGNTTTRPLHIAEGNADENAATLRQLRYECSETLNTARAEVAALRGSGAMTHDTLKKASEAINTLLAVVESDDTNLDTIKEVVAFIKNNKDVIDTIATSKLDKNDFNAFVEQMGSELQSITAALASKAASNHKHTAAEVSALPSGGTITVNGETKYLKDNPNFTVSPKDKSTSWQRIAGGGADLTFRKNEIGMVEMFIYANNVVANSGVIPEGYRPWSDAIDANICVVGDSDTGQKYFYYNSYEAFFETLNITKGYSCGHAYITYYPTS